MQRITCVANLFVKFIFNVLLLAHMVLNIMVEKIEWNPCVSTGFLMSFAESAFSGLILDI